MIGPVLFFEQGDMGRGESRAGYTWTLHRVFNHSSATLDGGREPKRLGTQTKKEKFVNNRVGVKALQKCTLFFYTSFISLFKDRE